MSKELISNFLSHFPNYYLQTFDDKAVDKSLTRYGTPQEFCFDELINLNKRGAGIFFTPNRFPKIRRKEECAGVNAWILEMDYEKAEQWKKLMECPISPSIIIETRKSYHCYWLAKDGTVENYDRITRGLIQYFNGDPACKDISRVFRIPWFFHNKQEPFLVKPILEDYDSIYTEEEMMKWYPYEEKKVVLNNNDFWDYVSKLNNRQMIQRLSGGQMVNGEIFTFRKRSTGGDYIDVNNKPADAWIDEKGFIGSGKGGGPTFIQWLEFYGHSKGEIAKWVKDYCKDLIPTDVLLKMPKVYSDDLIASDLKNNIFEIVSRKVYLTWGLASLDRLFSPLERSRYIVLVGETGVGKTAWAFQTALRNAETGKRVLYLSLEMSNSALVLRYVRAKMGIKPMEWRDRKFDINELNRRIDRLPKTLFMKQIDTQNTEINLDLINKIIIDGKYDMVFIDNFGFIEARGESVNEQMRKVSRGMVDLKNKTNTTIFALHHFRKGTDKSQVRRSLDSILGSSKIAHDVDFVLQVYRDLNIDEDSIESKKSEFIVSITKDRDWGGSAYSTVYYKNGEFYSNYEDLQKT